MVETRMVQIKLYLFACLAALALPTSVAYTAVTASPVSTTFISFPNSNSSLSATSTGLPTTNEDFTVEAYIFLPYWRHFPLFIFFLKKDSVS